MTPMAHRAPARRYQPCPGCATCQSSARRDRVIAKLVIVLFIGLFVLPIVMRWQAMW